MYFKDIWPTSEEIAEVVRVSMICMSLNHDFSWKQLIFESVSCRLFNLVYFLKCLRALMKPSQRAINYGIN